MLGRCPFGMAGHLKHLNQLLWKITYLITGLLYRAGTDLIKEVAMYA
jgi:hypothetical protein